jgi:hypothetical protein
MPAIPAQRRLRQEDPKFQAGLGYSETLSQKKNTNILHFKIYG